MATSDVLISNLALGMLGNALRIQSMNEASPQAKAMKLWFEPARDFTLEQRDWSFARQRIFLATHADAAPTNWGYRYQMPADCIAARYLVNPTGYIGHKIPYELMSSLDGETVTLVTDLQDAELVYTRRVTQLALFTPGFVMLCARALAMYTARTITGSRAEEDSQRQTLAQELRGVSAHDANQGADPTPPDSDMITGRY